MDEKLEKTEYDDIAQAINDVAEEINTVLNDCIKERYFEEIILLYSFIEYLLKWLLSVKILWEKSRKSDSELRNKEVSIILAYVKRLNFYGAMNVALSIDLIDFDLYKKIDAIRRERNDLVHQFWIYTHRNDLSRLRKKLEKLARTANLLVGIFNQLTEEIGVDEVYEIFL
jgi:hypothetical protein